MAVNYNVQAEVINLKVDRPKSTDCFLVDTNVWYWLTYPAASVSAQPYQINQYPPYIEAVVNAGSKLHCTGLSFAELAHRVEAAEKAISAYKSESVRIKEYRHNYPFERSKVVVQVQTAWNAISDYASQISCTVDDSLVNASLSRFHDQPLDGYDLFILEAMQQHSILQVITDDGDYVTVPGIQVFTANSNAIRAAEQQGKLIRR